MGPGVQRLQEDGTLQEVVLRPMDEDDEDMNKCGACDEQTHECNLECGHRHCIACYRRGVFACPECRRDLRGRDDRGDMRADADTTLLSGRPFEPIVTARA